jgi:hypothetical protein
MTRVFDFGCKNNKKIFAEIGFERITDRDQEFCVELAEG